MNAVNPHTYLKATLEAIAGGHPASDYRSATALGLYTNIKLKSRWCRRIAYDRSWAPFHGLHGAIRYQHIVVDLTAVNLSLVPP